jgi:site-specific DNA recombinase
MTKPVIRKLRCAVYTRKSSEEGLEQEFNSLHAQREACEAYIASQRSEGWVLVRDQYDDGGISGGTLERPALKRLMADIEDGLIDVVVVYKIDRLSRSLMDFSKLVEVFDRNGVTFVSVTQSFNTTTSMGRLTLNILLSLRPVRARGDRRAHPRQDPREPHEGHVDGRQPAARLRRQGPQAGGEPGAGRAGALDLRPLHRDRLGHGAPARGRRARDHQEARQAGRQAVSLPDPAQPGLYRRGGAQGRGYPGEHEAIIDADTWAKVHTILQISPRKRAARTRADTPALLKGLLFGPDGAAFSPTHTRKGGRLYRYYVSQTVLKHGAGSCPVGRVPAGEIEAAVIDQLRAVFRQPEIVAGTWKAARAQDGEIAEADAARPCSSSTRCGTNSSRPSRRASWRCWSSGSTSARTG